MVLPPSVTRYWEDPVHAIEYFLTYGFFLEITENIAAQESQVIEVMAPGKSAAEIKMFLGSPRYIERDIQTSGCPLASSHIDELWYYDLPGRILMLQFNDNKCLGVHRFTDWDKMKEYHDWKTAQIKAYAIGRTKEEIEAQLGKCFSSDSNLPTKESGEMLGIFWLHPNEVVTIEMHKGRCVQVYQSAVFY